jgi:hypothetical protein
MIKNNIYHRTQLTTKFVNDIINKKNILILIDEI